MKKYAILGLFLLAFAVGAFANGTKEETGREPRTRRGSVPTVTVPVKTVSVTPVVLQGVPTAPSSAAIPIVVMPTIPATVSYPASGERNPGNTTVTVAQAPTTIQTPEGVMTLIPSGPSTQTPIGDGVLVQQPMVIVPNAILVGSPNTQYVPTQATVTVIVPIPGYVPIP